MYNLKINCCKHFLFVIWEKKKPKGVIEGFTEKCSSTCFLCVATGVYVTDNSPSRLSLKDLQKYYH